MKKPLAFVFILAFCAAAAHGQGLPAIFKKSTRSDTAAAIKLPAIFSKNKPGANLGSEEVAAGLKQALQLGTERATGKLSAADGFF